MVHFVGLDVSVKATSVCVVDDAGKVILEQKVPMDPAGIIAVLTSLGVPFSRIGIEAGPLSQWLVNAMTAANLPVICVETRHMKALLTAQQISKTDRNDARGIAQMMRVGLFKPVHVKTLVCPLPFRGHDLLACQLARRQHEKQRSVADRPGCFGVSAAMRIVVGP
jgi:transposase